MLLVQVILRLWMWIDISLDIKQTLTYLNLAKDDKEEGFGIGYFFFSLMSLIIIPFPCLFLACAIEFRDVTQTMELEWNYYKKLGVYLLAIPFSYSYPLCSDVSCTIL